MMAASIERGDWLLPNREEPGLGHLQRLADVVVIIVSPLIMFIFFQRQIVSGFAAGIIKDRDH